MGVVHYLCFSHSCTQFCLVCLGLPILLWQILYGVIFSPLKAVGYRGEQGEGRATNVAASTIHERKSVLVRREVVPLCNAWLVSGGVIGTEAGFCNGTQTVYSKTVPLKYVCTSVWSRAHHPSKNIQIRVPL